jgi:hypothetical protein
MNSQVLGSNNRGQVLLFSFFFFIWAISLESLFFSPRKSQRTRTDGYLLNKRQKARPDPKIFNISFTISVVYGNKY